MPAKPTSGRTTGFSRGPAASAGRTAVVRRNGRAAAPEPDLRAALGLVMKLMALPGTSGQEGQVAAFITRELRAAGAAAGAIRTDDVTRRSPLGGETGNLVFRLPGTLDLPPRLLMAHMDTVPLCLGARPVLRGKFVKSDARGTGLGADNRAGCAVVLTAAREILRCKLPHPPLICFWTVQEEAGLFGAHYADLSLLGQPALAFNWDGGPPEKLTCGATGAYRMTIELRGVASHAGGAPEQGASAITMAGRAIASLERDGWLGDIHRDGQHGTSNIGAIHGGDATNVVTDRVTLRAECRSHDPAFRKRILAAFQAAFRDAAAAVRSAAGIAGKVKFQHRLDYEAFALPADAPCVTAAEAAARATGIEPYRALSNGGLDANWLTARGIPTVTLGCGQLNVHTTSERLDVLAYQRACRIALRLATAAESLSAEA